MDLLVSLHAIGGVALVLVAGLVGIWGLTRTRALASNADALRESRWFIQCLQMVHTLVVAEGLFGIMLYANHHRPADALHSRVYGPFMVAVIVASYAYRTKDAANNVRVFSIGALIIFALALRAVWTGQ